MSENLSHAISSHAAQRLCEMAVRIPGIADCWPGYVDSKPTTNMVHKLYLVLLGKNNTQAVTVILATSGKISVGRWSLEENRWVETSGLAEVPWPSREMRDFHEDLGTMYSIERFSLLLNSR